MKLFSIFLGIALIVCAPAFAGTTLSDSEMAGIYAGEVFVDLNEIDSDSSAAALQSNIGAIASFGPQSGVMILNENGALVANIDGNSAAAMQSNVGAIAALGGGVRGAFVKNKNKAIVVNTYREDAEDKGIDARTADIDVDASGGELNDLAITQSAVAAQSNIGAIVGARGVACASVVNKNCALVGNVSNRAILAAINNVN